MRIVLSACLLLIIAAPSTLWAQDIQTEVEGTETGTETSFPSDLMLLPQDIQDAALEGIDADEAEIPEGMSPAEEAFYRAQLSYATEDWVSARLYSETAAVGGIARAATLAGLIARDGHNMAPDWVQAAQWFRRAADQDEPVALYNLGLLALEEDETLGLGSARPWFERAARAGHIDAMIAYALELRASPVPQDAIGAREWAERAAQQGSAEGMYQLAQLLGAGIGGNRDIDGARIWYERAAETQHAEAAFQAGMMWANGEGGISDDEEALRWLRIAAESGFPPARGQYGLMLYQGRGTEPDPASAVIWFSQGAHSGDVESRILYARALALGDGINADLEEAYYWTLMAAHDAHGEPVDDPLRDRLQSMLENALPLDRQVNIRSRAASDR